MSSVFPPPRPHGTILAENLCIFMSVSLPVANPDQEFAVLIGWRYNGMETMSFTILYGNFVRKSFWSAIFEGRGVMMRGVGRT